MIGYPNDVFKPEVLRGFSLMHRKVQFFDELSKNAH